MFGLTIVFYTFNAWQSYIYNNEWLLRPFAASANINIYLSYLPVVRMDIKVLIGLLTIIVGGF